MDDATLDAIEARANKATPGPWWWAEHYFRSRIAQKTHTASGEKWRAKPGRKINATWIYLLLGAAKERSVPPPPSHPRAEWVDTKPPVDEWDYKQVCGMQWWTVKGDTVVNAVPGEADCAFIAHAREDVPALIGEVRRLKAMLAAEQAKGAQ